MQRGTAKLKVDLFRFVAGLVLLAVRMFGLVSVCSGCSSCSSCSSSSVCSGIIYSGLMLSLRTLCSSVFFLLIDGSFVWVEGLVVFVSISEFGFELDGSSV